MKMQPRFKDNKLEVMSILSQIPRDQDDGNMRILKEACVKQLQSSVIPINVSALNEFITFLGRSLIPADPPGIPPTMEILPDGGIMSMWKTPKGSYLMVEFHGNGKNSIHNHVSKSSTGGEEFDLTGFVDPALFIARNKLN